MVKRVLVGALSFIAFCGTGYESLSDGSAFILARGQTAQELELTDISTQVAGDYTPTFCTSKTVIQTLVRSKIAYAATVPNPITGTQSIYLTKKRATA